MPLLLTNGDYLLLTNGTDKLLLTNLDPIAILTHDAGPIGDVNILGSQSVASLTDDTGPTSQNVQFLAGSSGAFLSDNAGPVSQDVEITGTHFAAFISHGAGPLSTDANLVAHHDFTAVLTGAEQYLYVMDAVTPSGTVRIPISSWQATLRVERSNYLQCVIPAAGEWAADIAAMTAFSVSRVAQQSSLSVEYEMATVDGVLQKVTSRGPTRQTGVVSGFWDGFADGGPPDALFDRDLQGIRSLRQGGTFTTVRADIDFLLRPGHRAWIDDSTSIIVSYINYYVTQTRSGVEEYMDVGERL